MVRRHKVGGWVSGGQDQHEALATEAHHRTGPQPGLRADGKVGSTRCDGFLQQMAVPKLLQSNCDVRGLTVQPGQRGWEDPYRDRQDGGDLEGSGSPSGDVPDGLPGPLLGTKRGVGVGDEGPPGGGEAHTARCGQ